MPTAIMATTIKFVVLRGIVRYVPIIVTDADTN